MDEDTWRDIVEAFGPPKEGKTMAEKCCERDHDGNRHPKVVNCGPCCMFQVPVDSDDEALVEFLSLQAPLPVDVIENRHPGLLAACQLAYQAVRDMTGERPEKFLHREGSIQAISGNVVSETFIINPDISWPVTK